MIRSAKMKDKVRGRRPRKSGMWSNSSVKRKTKERRNKSANLSRRMRGTWRGSCFPCQAPRPTLLFSSTSDNHITLIDPSVEVKSTMGGGKARSQRLV